MTEPTKPDTKESTGDVPPPVPLAGGFDKDKANTYIELAKISQESFLNRRAMEWKVGFGLWTAIGLITYFAATNATLFAENTVNWIAWLYFAIAFIWQAFYHVPIRLAFEDDKSFKHYYMHRAEGRSPEWPLDYTSANFTLFKKREDDEWKWSFRVTCWILGQFLFTVTLLVGSWFVIKSAAGVSLHETTNAEFKSSNATVEIKVETNAKK